MKSMKIAVALLALVLVTSCIVGSTFAKYTSAGTLSDSTKVASWAFEVNDQSMTVESPTYTFNLFDTITEVDGTTNETDLSVTDGTIIAPGTAGKFDIKIENLSQVNATYAIDYTVTNTSNIPVKFSVNGTDWTDDLADVTATEIAHTNGTATITVQWKWEFDGDDTALGVAAAGATEESPAPTLTVTAVVTATQKD